MLLQLSDGRGIEDALRWGTAAGAAACLTPGTQLCEREAVLSTIDRVRVKRTSARAPARAK